MLNRPHGAAPRGTAADLPPGRRVTDPYRWLEEADSPRTSLWLRDRDREYERQAAAWPLRAPLAERIRALVDTDLWTPPRQRGPLLLATVRRARREHPALVALPARGWGPARTVYDPAEEDPGGGTTLDSWEPSPDGALVAVQTSVGGVEHGRMRVLDTASGTQAGPAVEGVRYSHVAWVPGPEPAFHYVRRDGVRGLRGVWLRRVADGSERLVHACTAPASVPGVRALDGRWLLISESHGTGHRTDLWLADLADPRPRPVQVGLEAETEALAGPDGLLYLRTTLDAPRRRVMAVSPEDPGVEHWREVVPEDDGATLDAFAPCGTAERPELLTVRTRWGISEASRYDARSGALLAGVDLPGEGMASALQAAPDGSVYLAYADVSEQQRVLRLPPGSSRALPWPPQERAAPPPPKIARTPTDCRSADGTRVRITVFAAPGTPEPGPTLLHAYGGFGRPRQFGFSATVLAWLLAGGRYAVAHVRGGGDAGRDWHLAGSGRSKPRAVEDLVAAADALVGRGLCTRAQLCLSGGSAGGLLVLAAATSRPDLCAAVIASAPLADMARFERLGLGRMWTREFGTAADPGDFAALMSYSPYHRALDRSSDGPAPRFPRVLLTGFHGDTRTDAAHPRKMCAALLAAARDRGEDAPRALLRYERDVGHGPRAVGRAVALAADAHAFAAHETGLVPGRPGAVPNRE
ncbi:prolyl oligopeptidase family serine peptidase [Nocardiopsis sp. LOL_012]|uniref:prolyl oligopeptidase family serine peptidase n=1 Tax=Nocardiopsis sp. LOL_012 TaxID=3345409 RepID=UPI003A8591CA